MKVSVIIPTFNRVEYLLKTISSVLSQTYTNLEIIVVDDASSDDTEKIFNKEIHDVRIKYVRLVNNVGVAQARNIGLKHATGDAILFWDSDDILYSDAIEMGVNILEQRHDVCAVAAPSRYIKNGNEIFIPRIESKLMTLELKHRGEFPVNNTFGLIRKSAIGENRFVAQNLDFVFYDRLLKRCNFYHLDHLIGESRIESDKNSLTIARRRKNVNLSIRRSQELIKYLNEFESVFKNYAPKQIANVAYGISVGLLLDNKTKDARRYARKAVRYWLTSIKLWTFFIVSHLPFSNVLFRRLFLLVGK